MKLDDLVLGVDGGGTKTVAWLVEADGDAPVGRGVSGPSNPGVAGKSSAIVALNESIDTNDSLSFDLSGVTIGILEEFLVEEEDQRSKKA